ncbi:MAG: hypothetical protein GEU90_21080 [Gemmatimonas sp.]|nr:hypothetical protein [Gemmatimonas sp.]
MRRLALLPLLLAALFLGACDDVIGTGQRSLDGEWSARIGGDEVWISLRDDRGDIRGSGEWGFDDVFVTGERYNSDVYLSFEFDRFNPIELEGVIESREIEGTLYGSGLQGERVRFRRE